MMTISSRFRESSLMSPRTAKYVEAMTREGENFDYDKWLKTVRQEEAEAKRAEATPILVELAAAEANAPISVPDGQRVRPNPRFRLVIRSTRPSRAQRWSHRQEKIQTPDVRLRRWLEKVRRAWLDFQASRTRDAVYGYLEAVFALVEHCRIRRRIKRLLRYAFEFANLPLAKRAAPFAAVIRCTSDRDIDSKTISKWSRALRYVARSMEPDIGLQTFMKKAGGINSCADRHARLMRHRYGS